MANDEVIGPRKTMFVLVIVVGCFAVLWPRILSPLVLGPTREQIQPNQFDREAALKQERAPPIRGMGPHPALRERGRAIPPGPPGPPPPPARPVTLPPHVRVRSPLSVYYKDEQVSSPVLDVWLAAAEWPQYQPPPIPGMRPPLGSPGGPVPAPKSSMGFVMPIYTICIIVFFVYTLTKIMFRRQGAPYDPITPDPHFRRRVFRDDSRSSPEKLGKKEADTIVTAISGLVAEVQQQMEASGAPNQQRQDVQDSARPFTNGTILLNSGPVQIVTSEYKEASKEKTPEPVIDKQSVPEPTLAEITKVLKEPVSMEDEYNSELKESHSEVEPSPQPVITEQENLDILETVVIKKSSPDSVMPEVSSLTSDTEPKLAKSEPALDLSSNESDEPLIYEGDKDSVLESLSDSKVYLDSTLQPNLNLVEGLSLSKLSEDIALLSDVKEISSELKESVLETKELLTKLLEQTVEVKEDLLQPISEPNKSPSELVKSNFDSDPEKLTEPKEHMIQSSTATLELKESEILSKEYFAKPDQTYIESEDPSKLRTQHIIPAPELKDPSLDPLPSATNPEVTSQETNEDIIQSKNLLQGEEPYPQFEESAILKQSSTDLGDDYSLQPIAANPEPKDPSLDLLPIAPKPDENLSQPPEPTPEHKERLLETIADFKLPSDPENTESNESLSNIKESIHEPVIIIPEKLTVTEDTDHFITEHKDSTTHKVSTPELLDESIDIKEHFVESSLESKISEYSPILEAQNVDRSPEQEPIEHSPPLKAPVVEDSSDLEHTVQSLEVDTPTVGSISGSKSETIILNDPTPQFKETTPEQKLIPEPKNIQVEQSETISEGALLDLEEAITDVDDRAQKQDKKESTDAETKLQTRDSMEQKDSEELLKIIQDTETLNDVKDDAQNANDKFLQGERFVVVRRSTPDVIEENKKLHKQDDYKLYTEADEEDIENAAVKVMAMEMTAHPVDGSEWPLDERPPPPAAPASPPPRAPHAAEEVKSIFLETEIPQQSRVLVAQFEEDRPHPAAHAPLVVSGKMTLSLIQDAPRDTPDRDPESTLDEFTTASAVTQAAAEKGEIESDEEIDEEIEVEEIELEEEEEEDEEEPPPVKVAGKK